MAGDSVEAWVLDLDRALVEACRGFALHDLRIARGLASLAVGERSLVLGYARVVDYARERLGLSLRSAQAALRLGEALPGRPLLWAALEGGEISARKAQVILSVAVGRFESTWIRLARETSVRRLTQLVREQGGEATDEAWDAMVLKLSPEERARFDAGLEVARRVLGPAAPRFRLVEAMCQETLSEVAPLDASRRGLEGRDAMAASMAPVQEEGSGCCDLPEAAHEEDPPSEPFGLDRWLRAQVRERASRDERLGRLALLAQRGRIWRDLGYESFDDYCADRLGLSARTVRQRAWLERRLEGLPPLREAMRDGRITYSKALVLARSCDAATIEAGIVGAEGSTCLDLQREAEKEEDRQMCARGRLKLFGPAEFCLLLEDTICALQEQAVGQEGDPISSGEALARIADHYREVWEAVAPKLGGRRARIFGRTEGLCAVPGCARAAVHLHHIRYRSAGGDDSDANLVGLCVAHHLLGVHQGRIRIRTEGDKVIIWELGLQENSPLEVRIGRVA